MGKIYQLDLRTLLDSLSQQSVTLSAELPKGLPGVRAPCTGRISLDKGRIVECVIFGKNGTLKEGKFALDLLLPVMEWHVELQRENIEGQLLDEQLSGPVPVPPPELRSSQIPGVMPTPFYDDIVPRPCRPLPAAHIQALAAKDRLTLRMVLAMVDGQRSIRQIKESLQLSPYIVEQVLQYLLQLQAVEI